MQLGEDVNSEYGIAHSIRSCLSADRASHLYNSFLCNVDLTDHDQGACLKSLFPLTTMVQSTIHSNYTTVHDGRTIVAKEVDLFLIYCL